MSNVGIVIVSHSADVARGAADMVRQMVGGTVALAHCGGDPDGGLGTDAGAIMAAIDAAWSEAGVAILADLGGAALNSEMAIEMQPPERAGLIVVCDAPIVEGAVVAATEASGGAPLAAVRRAAEALTGHREDATPAAPAGAEASDTVVVRNPHGLHARPAVKLAQRAKSFAADIRIAAGPSGPWADAKSVGAVLGARIGEGATLHVRAAGSDAAAAVAELIALVAEGFGEAHAAPAPPPSAPRIAAPGVAMGPVVPIGTAIRTSRAAGDPATERDQLAAAIESAVAETEALAARTGGDGADMLAFQVAMLRERAGDALALVAAGRSASEAWRSALDATTARLADADDAYMQARAADVVDLRDRVLRHLAGADQAATPPGAILVGADIGPGRFLETDWTAGGGIALAGGSAASHVAMLARARGVPMLVGLGDIDIAGHATAIVDAEAGRLILSPDAAEVTAFAAAREAARTAAEADAAAAREPAVTRGGDLVRVTINVADPYELDGLDPGLSDGVGLVRTELLFAHGVADEETQVRAYRRIAEWAEERPVTLRTLDAGGDKPIPGVTIDGESNPFLGTRGIRLSLARPEPFRLQLRAMARAAVHGNVRIMLPMVTVPGEIDAAAALLDAAVEELARDGIPHRRPPLGVMVEVPVVAIAPDLFARAAFFSIGSNDLTQYVTASARDIAAVAALNDAGHPAVIALIRNVVEAGRRLGRDVSLCGDMGGEPAHIPALIAAGLRSVSVAPRQVGRTKRAIREA